MRTVVPKDAYLVPPQAKRVFKGVIYDVYQWQQKRFDDSTVTFEMLKRPDTVKVIAVKDNKIVVLKEEQPDHPRMLTLPGGRNDNSSETELDCAKRELHEETGMVFNTWKLLSAVQEHRKIEQIVYIFLATGFERQDASHTDPGEKIEISFMSFDEAKKYANTALPYYWPTEILRRVNSLDELLNLPAITS